ncbi:hypothetical protein [Nocardia sp. alder85J]|uniref:hypothetical protein n=1 Tax=Nocardia sp. alder85J TaxID=2862949 RepID=UPI001CD4D8D8|nr:hypothetical protein [Nocardia sp. alder85J]MCX4099221.1 hypothetical protein [Nocardia sp. alder85J]
MSDAQWEARQRVMRFAADGGFDLRRNALPRIRLRGWGAWLRVWWNRDGGPDVVWLLVLIPVAVLLAAVMASLLLLG